MWLSYHGLAEFNRMEFSRIHGFARHFSQYGDLELLWNRSKLILLPVKVHENSMDFQSFLNVLMNLNRV